MSDRGVEFEHSEFRVFVNREKGRFAQGTWKNRQSGLVKYEKWLGERGLDFEEVGGRDVDSFLSWMTRDVGDGGEGLADLTAWEYLTAVRKFYDWYWMDEDAKKNPARKVSTSHLSRSPEHEKPTLEESELRSLVESAESVRGRALLSLMASTGLRLGEAVSLELDQVDLQERKVSDVETLKRDDEDRWRDVWFDRTTRRYLREWVKGGYREQYASESDYLFTSYGERGEHMSTDRGREEFVGAVKNCEVIADRVDFTEMANGVERCSITTHILRRSFCQNYIDNGGTVMQLKALAGWKDLETAMQYVDDSCDRETRDKYGVAL